MQQRLIEAIIEFTENSPENDLKKANPEKAWAQPLIGFSRGDDPIFEMLKKDIGDFWWTPLDAFRRAFPDEPKVTADQLSVISWVLPHTAATMAAQKAEALMPSEGWARTRLFGEAFNNLLRRHVVEWLAVAGYQSTAPVLLPECKMMPHEKYTFAAPWSERHAAYIAGLGTFGLCDGLITPVGKAVRIGSAVAKLALSPTPRPYQDRHEYCLFFSQGSCRACARRCPAGAITENGHDKIKCEAYVGSSTTYIKEKWGIDIYGCGLCQAGVPCATGIPEK